jgi:hypothetical protein
LDCEGNGGTGPEVRVSERIRVQTASVDFNAQQFLQTDITEMDVPSKMIQEGKLAWLVRRFEHDCVEPERIDKPLCICGVQPSVLIEESDSSRAFSRFDDQLDRSGVEPFLPLVDPRSERPVAEPAVMFLPELHLNIEAAALRGRDNLTRVEIVLGETLTSIRSA